jgi:N-methylhydantoinase A
LYDYATAEPVEAVTLRVAALVPTAELRLPEREPSGPAIADESHACYMPGFGNVDAIVYRRNGLPIGDSVAGPALIQDDQSTTVLLPGQTARADAVGNLMVEVQ